MEVNGNKILIKWCKTKIEPEVELDTTMLNIKTIPVRYLHAVSNT